MSDLPSGLLLWHYFFIFKQTFSFLFFASLCLYFGGTVTEFDLLATFPFPSLTQEVFSTSFFPVFCLCTCRNMHWRSALLALCLQPCTVMRLSSSLPQVILYVGTDQFYSETVLEGWLSSWQKVLPFIWRKYYCTLWPHIGWISRALELHVCKILLITWINKIATG